MKVLRNSMDNKVYHHHSPITLENGKQLSNLTVAYHSFGKLNEAKNNVVWVCHALTANSNVLDWWNGLFGENFLFNPNEYFIICPNNLGSCYGTSGPTSINPNTQKPYYSSFPEITVRDMVQVHELLRLHLNIEKIDILIGGSQGGQQALEWNIYQPNIFNQLILLATNAVHSPWGIAFNESQRMAIFADETYFDNKPNGGSKGLAVARSIALLSYRNYKAYYKTQSESNNDLPAIFKAASYQNYQGKKLVDRFNAYSYVILSKAMDSHNVARNKQDLSTALKKITASTLIIGINSDILFPVQEQQFLADNILNAQFETINSDFGHDGFLVETKKITAIIKKFLDNNTIKKNKSLHVS
ncbi:MAG: homoserine O-acetyltransferase MetX [Chitinophagaceae bacterium]